ncbi:hypothetical protein U0070_026721, partial [Myodes glareolus]
QICLQYTKDDISKSPYTYCRKGITLQNNPTYSIRSILFRRLFLSLLPLKPSTYTRPRRLLTANRFCSTMSSRSSSAQQHISPLASGVSVTRNLWINLFYSNKFPRPTPITFLLFDLEITLLLPLPRALQISNLNSTTLIAFILITILALGLAYNTNISIPPYINLSMPRRDDTFTFYPNYNYFS